MNDDDLTPDDLVRSAVSELLNIAAGVADLQLSDQGAEDIFAICDLVAEYHGIERATIVTEQTEDGSYNTRVVEDQLQQQQSVEPIPGSIRTSNRPKLRVVDYTPRSKKQ